MKDSIHIKKNGKGFKLTRTLAEEISPKELDERIKKVEHDIEAYTDTYENLTENKEKLMQEHSERIDRDAKGVLKQLDMLKANLQALKDAKILGQGKASTIVKGDTAQGVTE